MIAGMKFHSWIVISAVSWALGFNAAAEVRTWKNAEGVALQAEITDATETHVTLKLENGQSHKLPLEKLSAEDQQFAAKWFEAREAAAEKELGENWDEPWPKLVKTDVSPDIETVKEDEAAGEFVYRSPTFEFHSDVQLSGSVVKRFSVLFEATAELCRKLPISLQKPHVKREKRLKVELFGSKANYITNGGPAESAGVYMSGRDVVMVPLTSLGVERVGDRYIMDHDKENKTLTHEIVHQLTDLQYYAPGARGWFSEGLAEYVGLSPYRMGSYSPSGVMNPMKEYVTAYGKDGNGGRALGEEIALPSLQVWMNQSYANFLANAQVNYGSAALVFYYFAHMDGDKEGSNLKAFCLALREGKRGEEAIEALRAGRTYEEMEAELTKAWRGRGVKFTFN
ncbi:MAG: hypothetical protein ACI8UO_001415 [Verrucomicrobiales bacterium]|jgi:hypothetical protein